MNPNDRFEILAAAFYMTTGIMPPGKDDIRGDHTIEERTKAWDEFNKTYGHVCYAVMLACQDMAAAKTRGGGKNAT